MTVLRMVLRGVSAVRPYARQLTAADRDSKEHHTVALVRGEPEATALLAGLVDWDGLSEEDALIVWAPDPRADVEATAADLARRKRDGTPILALLVGPPGERRLMERRVGVGRGLELGDTAQVGSLRGVGARRVAAAIAARLGDRAPAVARREPGLRPAVGRVLVARAARRAAAVATVGIAASSFTAISAIQVGMIANVAALHDRDLDAQSAVEAAAVLGAGLGWRALARGGAEVLPLAGPVVRAGVAYATTRALGELAYARFSGGEPLVGEIPPSARVAADKIIQRLPGTDLPGSSEGSEG